MTNSFQARSTLTAGDRSYEIWSLAALPQDKLARLPYSLKILLENLLRFEDGVNVTRADIEALLEWDPQAAPSHEIAFTPARVILQDFTGVPCVVDLAAMRDAIVKLGGDAERVNPLAPAELVIDHSVQVDEYGFAGALAANTAIEFARNGERYAFLRWGQTAFRNFAVVPPNTGIVHQVNLEYLGRVIFDAESARHAPRLPRHAGRHGLAHHHDQRPGRARLGRRRHRGRGRHARPAGHHADPAGHRLRLEGKLQPGATATDLVLTVTEMLRKKGVVDKFVEFFGDGLANLPLADRATIANMAPEYGSTCGLFPIDAETVRYLELSGRPRERIELVSAYAKAQGMWRTRARRPPATPTCWNSTSVRWSRASPDPRRPQDRVPLKYRQVRVRDERQEDGRRSAPRTAAAATAAPPVTLNGQTARSSRTARCSSRPSPAAPTRRIRP